jgi:hypothetical protein
MMPKYETAKNNVLNLFGYFTGILLLFAINRYQRNGDMKKTGNKVS